MKIKPLILLLISALTVNSSIAQTEEPITDTVSGIDTAFNYFDENLDQTDADQKEKKPEKKPYVRIVMPFDTITELITYTGVVEQTDSYVDSLYERAKNWIAAKWGGGVKKGRQTMEKKFAEDVLYDKFKISLIVPLMVKVNPWNAVRNGDLQFTLEMRFKDGKYKYKFTNLVHILPVANNRKEPEYVYCEYYKGAEKNIVYSDRVLRGADAQINKMVEEIKKALKERIEIDEDDW